MKPFGPTSAAAAINAGQNVVSLTKSAEISTLNERKKEESKKYEGSTKTGLRSISERKIEDLQKVSFNEFLKLFKKDPDLVKYNDIKLFSNFEENDIELGVLVCKS